MQEAELTCKTLADPFLDNNSSRCVFISAIDRDRLLQELTEHKIQEYIFSTANCFLLLSVNLKGTNKSHLVQAYVVNELPPRFIYVSSFSPFSNLQTYCCKILRPYALAFKSVILQAQDSQSLQFSSNGSGSHNQIKNLSKRLLT